MYYISDYRKRAIDKIVPYLIEFPQIVKIIENSADRYQAIEDILWKIANNFNVEDARGIFIDVLAHNEVVDIVYTDKAEDAFTYGTDKPLYQAYGTGHYYSQSSYISGISKNVSEDKMIRAIKAKIIENNTSGTIEDLIEALKLYFNAKSVRVSESYPLALSIMLEGDKLELSSSGNYEVIRRMLPACVSLKDLYVNPQTFNVFDYSNSTSYGDSRYAVKIGDTTDVYKYISHSINLRSVDEEYIKTNHDKFAENMYCCFVGSVSEIEDESILLSSYNGEDGFDLQIYQDPETGYNHFAIKYSNILNISDILVELDKEYTFIIYNNGTSLKLWILNGTQINGQSLEKDISFIRNKILFTESNLTVENFITIDAPIYINCKNINDITSNYCNFIYHAIVFGDINIELVPTEYYVTCFGEKQILFNCFENKNHLYINTKNLLNSNITVNQSVYNYLYNHSNNRYVYFDGKSGINYKLNDNVKECSITNFKISFDLCIPIELSDMTLLCNFIGENNFSKIRISQDGKIFFDCNEKITTINEETGEEIEGSIVESSYIFANSNVEVGKFIHFDIEIAGRNLSLYQDNIFVETALMQGNIYNIQDILIIGHDVELSSFYKGFIKNVNIDIIGLDENELEVKNSINLPYLYNLKDGIKLVEYENAGVRFITVPQLISDSTNLDIYGNNLIIK